MRDPRLANTSRRLSPKAIATFQASSALARAATLKEWPLFPVAMVPSHKVLPSMADLLDLEAAREFQDILVIRGGWARLAQQLTRLARAPGLVPAGLDQL